ncbi:response regulator transcription factor [Rhodanobacter sp. BL-MT-08]
MKILVVEDDPGTGAHIASVLSIGNQVVDRAMDGRSGLSMATAAHYDLIIVDRMLPHLDGMSLVRTIRRQGSQTPVLMLSALGEVDHRVEGLDAGADDYLAKPFAQSELKARVSALARRAPLSAERSRLHVDDLELDTIRREAHRAGRPIELQPREFRLLEYLMTHAGKVVTRSMLLEQVWEFYFDPGTSLVETHISRLRAKIDRGFKSPLLITVRGAGYSLRAPD